MGGLLHAEPPMFIIMEKETGLTQEEVKKCIKKCEGKHVQQVAYSSYHDTLTQVCFGCDKVRTSLKDGEL